MSLCEKAGISGRAMPSSLYATGPCPEACVIHYLDLRAGCVGKDDEHGKKGKEHDDDEEEEKEEKEAEGDAHRSSVGHSLLTRKPFEL